MHVDIVRCIKLWRLWLNLYDLIRIFLLLRPFETIIVSTRKSLIALAFGTFGLGMTEFAMMGILPFVASDFGISIPNAGRFISAYALGVCVGAPVMALSVRRWPMKRILILLMSIFVVASLGVCLCPSGAYGLMLVLRFLQGVPHGSYFSVGCIVADRISEPGKSSFSIAIMCAGMSVANIVGNPLATLISGFASWRLIYSVSFAWGVLTLLAIMRYVPYVAPLRDSGVRGQFRFLKHGAPWLMVGATLLGNGGIFCWYSYVNPMLTSVAGISSALVPLVLVLAGVGMFTGNLVGGKLSDRFKPGHIGRMMQYIMLVSSLGLFFFGQYVWCAVPLVFFGTFALFGVSSPQQLLLIRYAEGGELMGGAMVQIAFNFGNAIGAFAGGLPISSGLGYEYSALVGAGFVIVGLACYTAFCMKYER